MKTYGDPCCNGRSARNSGPCNGAHSQFRLARSSAVRALTDDRLTALDAKSGKEIWTVKSPEPVTHANGYAMTGAPLVVNGVVIMGVAGAEFSHRGLLEGYDAKTGKHLW